MGFILGKKGMKRQRSKRFEGIQRSDKGLQVRTVLL